MVVAIKDAARMIQSHTTSSYIYRNVIVEVDNSITSLDYRTDYNYNRSINSKYTISIRDNVFDKKDLEVIFSNIDYLIGIIQKRIFQLFNNNDYDGVEDNFQVLFDQDSRQIIVSFDYEISDTLTPEFKNVMVTEIIIGTLLDGAVELADSDESNECALKLITSDGSISNAQYGTKIRI